MHAEGLGDAAGERRPVGAVSACTGAGRAGLAALAYMVLLPLDVPLWGPLRLHDLLVPAFAAWVLWRRDYRRAIRMPDALLLAFLTWVALLTVWRLAAWEDAYRLVVWLYVVTVYAFFSRTALSTASLGGYAIVVAALCLAIGLWQCAAGGVGFHDAYAGSTLSLLTTRYAGRFGNPNQFASFGALPVVCALLALAGCGRGRLTRPLRTVLLGATGVCLLLVLLTVSRHMLLSIATVLGLLAWACGRRGWRAVRSLAWVAVLSAGGLFLVTVLFAFFPLRPVFPYFNADTPGMYTIHHVPYLHIVTDSPGAFLFGVGRSGVRRLYPMVIDQERTRRILAAYRMEHLSGSFAAYMDAHNEYLGTAASFGVPAVLLVYGFLLALALRMRRNGGAVADLAAFFLAALLIVSLWDDILSKRWTWVVLGLLAAQARQACDAGLLPSGAPAPLPERE